MSNDSWKVLDEGLLALLGKKVTIFLSHGNYVYQGLLIGVSDTFVKLSDAHIVYESEDFIEAGFKDAQRIAPTWYVSLNLIESFGELPNK